MPLLTKPYEYQVEDAQRITEFNGRALVASEPGTGKTLTSLLYVLNHKRMRPVVVICPASLKWNWQREIRTHTGMSSVILEKMRVSRRATRQKAPIWIINYDILGPWLEFLKSLSPEIVIIDECHAIKSRNIKRTKRIRQLCKNVPSVIAMSGTPLTNRPAELFSVLNLLRPDIYSSWFAYASEFCNLQKKPWGWVYSGARNLRKLHRDLSDSLMIRRRKEDVLGELPEKIREVITLPISNREEYNEAVNNFVGWLDKKSHSLARNAAKAEQITKLTYLKRVVAELKLPAVMEWIDNYLEETEEKLLIYCVHRSIIKKLYERYKNISVFVHGGITGNKRQLAFDAFNDTRNTRLLIGNIQAAGAGWDARMPATAFVELAWTPGDHDQCEGRSHGLNRGVKGVSPSYFYLLGDDTIDVHLCKQLQNKAKTLDTVLDGRRMRGSLDIYDKLTDIIRKEHHASSRKISRRTK